MEWHQLNSRLLLFYVAILVVVCGSKACFQEERAALLNLKVALVSWVNDPNSDCCGWDRVTCDSASGHVTRLSLGFLYGATPHADVSYPYKRQCLNFLTLNFSLFVPFKELRSLDLSFNCFGEVFAQDSGGTSALKMLETLDLSNCAFNLSIMKMLSSFTSLKTLLLRNNNLDGPFPVQELLALQNLEQLDLSGNVLEIPSTVQDFKWMSALKKLETLDLSYSFLFEMNTSSIFKSLSALKSLKNLVLSNTDIAGPLPVHDLSLLQNLETLDLSSNQLSSPSTTADSRTLSRLKRLRTLDLSGNDLGKRTIKFLSHLPALRSLILSYNRRMIGQLDDEDFANLSNLEVLILRYSAGPQVPIQGLCKIKNLQELDLSGNNLTGTLPSFSCLGNMTSLRALDLSSNNLSGNISSSFVALHASLEYLFLSDNNFEGTFPLSSLANYSELKVLTLGGMHNKNFQVETENPPWVPSFQLQYLDMANCQVNSATRTVPTFLSYQRGLRYIDLSSNDLVDRFPNWLLVNNPKLEGVFLNNNSFDGSFLLPSDEGQHIDHLYILDISHNKIQDKLPGTLGFFFPYLEYLNASGNVLDGGIPASIGKMSVLKTLDLAYNNLSGELPKDMFMGCFSLQILRLSHNRFQGQILPTPLRMISLKLLMMDNNHFDGTLQDGLLSIQDLKVLDISNNKLSGELPGWVGNLTLNFLSVSWNDFKGAIPTELCKIEELTFVSLSHNRFFGAIPSCLGMSSSLEYIHLRNNSITGTIPESILRSSRLLVSLDLGDNKISGSIPKTFSGLAYLKFLSLAGNQLQGRIPRQICELKELNFLDLSRNNFTGSIPTCFNNISFGNGGDNYGFLVNYFMYSYLFLFEPDLFDIDYQYLHLDRTYDNDAGYWIPEEMQFTTKGSSFSYKGNILNYMSGLDLSCNQLSGKIPQKIGDLIDLHALNLSHNYLDGSIPKSFQKLKKIESLDLSFNRLSGPIPLQLQDLNYLSVFNVSYNNLSGRAPDKGQFATFGESSYRGNQDLSWNISNRGIAPPPPPPPATTTLNNGENNSAIDFTSFCWTFAASYVMVILMFIAILWINPYWRRAWFYFIEDCLYKCFGGVLKDAFY